MVFRRARRSDCGNDRTSKTRRAGRATESPLANAARSVGSLYGNLLFPRVWKVMVHDRSQDVGPAVNGQHSPRQAIAGLMPPQVGEAMIREVWPTIMGVQFSVASLSSKLMKTFFLAPLGWMLNGLLFGKKFAPFLCKRYTLTNRRLMIQHGWKPAPVQEVPLKDIDDVRLIADTYDAFYRSGDLEVLSG